MNFEPTKTVTFQENEVVVADLPKEVQRLIEVYDDIRQSAGQVQVEQIKHTAALRDLNAQIGMAVDAHFTKENASKDAAAPADDVTEAEEE